MGTKALEGFISWIFSPKNLSTLSPQEGTNPADTLPSDFHLPELFQAKKNIKQH